MLLHFPPRIWPSAVPEWWSELYRLTQESAGLRQLGAGTVGAFKAYPVDLVGDIAPDTMRTVMLGVGASTPGKRSGGWWRNFKAGPESLHADSTTVVVSSHGGW